MTIEPVASDSMVARAVFLINTTAKQPRVIEMTLQSTCEDGLVGGATAIDIDLHAVIVALNSSSFGPQRAGRRGESSPAAGDVSATSRTLNKDTDVTNSQERSETKPLSIAAESYRTSGSTKERAYRRMPPSAELKAVHMEKGTITAVAKHYGVPRHTAQGWMIRMRKMGHVENSPNDSTGER